MKKTRHDFFNNARLLLLLVLCLGVVFSTTGSLAAFTNQGYRKGVVTTNSPTVMFSSNLLDPVSSTQALSVYTLTFPDTQQASDYVTKTLNIKNHSKMEGIVNPQDITYKLTFSVKALDGKTLSGNNYTVTVNGEEKHFSAESNLVLENQTLLGKVSSDKSYSIGIPSGDIGKNEITITAEPENKSVTGGMSLARKLTTMFYTPTQTEAKSFTWDQSGLPYDKTSTNDSSEFSAFNFEITGLGKGTGTLTWDTTYVELDQHFLEELKKNGYDVTTSGTKKITLNNLPLDSTDPDQSYYLLQFYRKQAAQTGETWDAIFGETGWIQFSAEEEVSGEGETE